jgi:pimeloyl-ACP methyl ester carboxylesterase
VRRVLLSRPADGSDPEQVVQHLEHVLRLIGSPAFPPEPERMRERLRRSVARAWRPAGTARQLAAVVADGDRSPLMPRISAPTRVIHGEADPLVPAAAGRDLVARISGAQGEFIPGWGHDLPLQLLPRLAESIAENAARA